MLVLLRDFLGVRLGVGFGGHLLPVVGLLLVVVRLLLVVELLLVAAAVLLVEAEDVPNVLASSLPVLDVGAGFHRLLHRLELKEPRPELVEGVQDHELKVHQDV